MKYVFYYVGFWFAVTMIYAAFNWKRTKAWYTLCFYSWLAITLIVLNYCVKYIKQHVAIGSMHNAMNS